MSPQGCLPWGRKRTTQRLWRSIMRLLADWVLREEFIGAREARLLRRRQFPQLFLIGDVRLRSMVQQSCGVTASQ